MEQSKKIRLIENILRSSGAQAAIVILLGHDENNQTYIEPLSIGVNPANILPIIGETFTILKEREGKIEC